VAELAPLFARIQDDLTAARRAQNKDTLLLLGTVLADLRNRELEQPEPLTNDQVIDVIRKGIKRRRESQAMYETGARPELAAREAAEAASLEAYLPPAVSSDELRAAVRAAIASGAANMGAVMGRVVPQFKGRADGSQISAIVKEELASKS
jgi:uncharacterized protein YqeY